MKKLLIIIVVLLALTGCASDSEETVNEEDGAVTEAESAELYDYAKDFLLTENDYTVSVSADWAIDIRDINVIKDISTDIFVGRVLSKDGCTPISGNSGFHGLLYTYGSIEVIDTIKGEAWGKINYVRNGGIMSYAEYLEQAPEEMREKHLSLIQGEMPQYISVQMEFDIPIETGKTYLIFSIYDAETDRYHIDFAQYGLREVTEKDGDLFVRDNDSKELNLLKEVVASLTD